MRMPQQNLMIRIGETGARGKPIKCSVSSAVGRLPLQTRPWIGMRDTVASTCGCTGSECAVPQLLLSCCSPPRHAGQVLQEALDELDTIRTINFIRRALLQDQDPISQLTPGTRPWADDAFLQPVLPDDALLCHDFQDATAPECACPAELTDCSDQLAAWPLDPRLLPQRRHCCMCQLRPPRWQTVLVYHHHDANAAAGAPIHLMCPQSWSACGQRIWR